MSRFLFSLLTLLIFIPLPGFAGDMEIKSDKSSYQIGDLVKLKVTIEGKGFTLADMDKKSLAPFEYAGKEENFNEESGITTLTIKGYIFKVGDFDIPPFEVKDGEGKSYKTATAKISVEPLLKGDEKGINPLKGQLEIDEGGPLWPWLIAALVLAAMAAAIRFFRRMKVEEISETPVEVIPPYIEAMKELERIEGLNLLRDGKIKEYYTLIGDALRNFEGRINGFDAMEMTTEELAGALEIVKSENIASIKKFLTDCDMVKFAKYTPPDMDISALMDKAREIINKDNPDEAPDSEAAGSVKGMEKENAL